jgi:hypothetical protein
MTLSINRNSSQKSQSHQRKRPRKGHKSLRGVPELYETTKERIYCRITDASSAGIDSISSQFHLSRSELIEQIGRQIIAVDMTRLDIHQPTNPNPLRTRCFALTRSGVMGIDQIAHQSGLSRRDFIEQIGLGNIEVKSN